MFLSHSVILLRPTFNIVLVCTFVLAELSVEATAGSSGQWAVWSEWSSCSGQCGHGQQTRRRSCFVSHHVVADEQCSGQYQQTRTCSLDRCKGHCLRLLHNTALYIT